MTSSWRSKPFVPAFAVGAVTLAALGASWFAPSAPASGIVAASARPAAGAEVRVVKAPSAQATIRPVACRDCVVPSAPAGRY